MSVEIWLTICYYVVSELTRKSPDNRGIYFMRTTLINTTFWEEREMDSLHLDSKLLYLYFLTNPKKCLANIYHYKPKVISAYCGLGVDQIEVAVKQLIELNYIAVYNDYYILLRGHEMPKKGRFTEQTINKEKSLVPADVLEFFNTITTVNSSGVAPEHIYIDNNKSIVKPINEKATVLANLLSEKITENFPFIKNKSYEWSSDIEKINRIDGHDYTLIEFIILWSQNDSFWKKNIRSGDKLRKQFTSLMVQAKCDSDRNQRKVARV